VLEPLNETQADEALGSRALLNGLIAEIRSVLPQHTLVASGHNYAGIPELDALQPLADRNVVYTFHYYEPHNFTHQGATWGPPLWNLLRNWPYPSSPERVAPLLDKAKPSVRDSLKWHGAERWGRAKIAAQIERAARWSERHGVPLWCSEFGVLRKRVVPADRHAWLRDVRETLEARKIPWTHWDYAGDFGVVTGKRGERKVDEGVVKALGLPRRG
jgi:endoglucanase